MAHEIRFFFLVSFLNYVGKQEKHDSSFRAVHQHYKYREETWVSRNIPGLNLKKIRRFFMCLAQSI